MRGTAFRLFLRPAINRPRFLDITETNIAWQSPRRRESFPAKSPGVPTKTPRCRSQCIRGSGASSATTTVNRESFCCTSTLTTPRAPSLASPRFGSRAADAICGTHAVRALVMRNEARKLWAASDTTYVQINLRMHTCGVNYSIFTAARKIRGVFYMTLMISRYLYYS